MNEVLEEGRSTGSNVQEEGFISPTSWGPQRALVWTERGTCVSSSKSMHSLLLLYPSSMQSGKSAIWGEGTESWRFEDNEVRGWTKYFCNVF